MHLGLEGKVVLLTGGTKGIGRSMVRSFLSEGATVYFCSRTQPDIDAANQRLAADFPNGKAIGTSVDISKKDQLVKWVESCAEKSGKVDVVVANAATLSTPNTVESWEATCQVDLLGFHNLVQSAIPHLEKSKGNIVAITSVSGRDIDFTGPGPYGASKAAIIHYTASLARSLAPKGVRANSCSPGNIYIEDGVFGNIERGAPELFKSQLGKNPTGRMGKPEEVADAVLFLASERATFVSGSNFVVDGALCTGVQF